VASAGHVQVCTLLQTDNHTSTSPLSFLQAGCPSCRPTNSVKALKATCEIIIADNATTYQIWSDDKLQEIHAINDLTRFSENDDNN